MSQKSLDTALFVACYAGRTEEVLELLASGAGIEAKNNDGDGPLSIAAIGGHSLTCEALLKRGADLEERNIMDNSALAMAAYWGKTNVCQTLLSHGADPESRNSVGDTALALAAYWGNTETCIVLIEGGANLEAKNILSDTALGSAAHASRSETCLVLVAHGANVPSAMASKPPLEMHECLHFPLHTAAILGMTSACVDLLEFGYDPAQKNAKGLTPVQRAESAKENETAAALRAWVARKESHRILGEMAGMKP